MSRIILYVPLYSKYIINCLCKTWSVLNLLSKCQLWNKSNDEHVSVCCLFFHFARLPIFKAVLSHDRVCLHITTWFLQPIRLHRNHKSGHLIIKSMKLPKTLLRVLKKTRQWGQNKAGEQGRRQNQRQEVGFESWQLCGVWPLNTHLCGTRPLHRGITD